VHEIVQDAWETPTHIGLGDVVAAQLNPKTHSGNRVFNGSDIQIMKFQLVTSAGLVRGEMSGRECLFEFTPEPLQHARDYPDLVADQWNEALVRLKAHVERSR
jgi:hypothetical protein